MRAEILTIGDELCRGEIVDTNSSWLAAQALGLDITTRWMTSCRDDEADITAALHQAVGARRPRGLLGRPRPHRGRPDRRRGRRLAGSRARRSTTRAEERMARAFAAPDSAMPPRHGNPAAPGARPGRRRVHANPAGLAPGFESRSRGVPVVCMPGVPRELHAIFDADLEARLRELRGRAARSSGSRAGSIACSGAASRRSRRLCRGLVDGVAGASIHYQVKFPETLVKVVVRDRDGAAARGAARRARRARCATRLAGFLYGTATRTWSTRSWAALIEARARRSRPPSRAPAG